MALILKKYSFCSMVLTPFLLSFLFLIVAAFSPGNNLGKASANETKRWKILHIMSYHSPWKWTDGQLNGFQAALQGLDIDYKVFQMDTKRRSDPAWKENVGRQARELIETWKPDLVYTSDDYAQESVAKHYLNKDLPFVFSGVNADPSQYEFVGSKNITGVLEEEHFVESVQLLKKLVPTVKKIAVIYDDDPTWPEVMARMKKNLAQLPDIQITSYDLIHTFKQFQERLAALPQEADAVCLLGIFTFKDEHGHNVSYKEVLRWFLGHSRLPDFSFWQDRIYYGTLCSVNVSEYEQGLAAGRLARGILLEGRSPSSYPMEPTVKGVPMINLPRAQQLGINIKTSILLTATVVNEIKTD
jgi:ABC-type uncharacterized transport system substrate-binding protein